MRTVRAADDVDARPGGGARLRPGMRVTPRQRLAALASGLSARVVTSKRGDACRLRGTFRNGWPAAEARSATANAARNGITMRRFKGQSPLSQVAMRRRSARRVDGRSQIV